LISESAGVPGVIKIYKIAKMKFGRCKTKSRAGVRLVKNFHKLADSGMRVTLGGG
jgi:hypothetical protein